MSYYFYGARRLEFLLFADAFCNLSPSVKQNSKNLTKRSTSVASAFLHCTSTLSRQQYSHTEQAETEGTKMKSRHSNPLSVFLCRRHTPVSCAEETGGRSMFR